MVVLFLERDPVGKKINIGPPPGGRVCRRSHQGASPRLVPVGRAFINNDCNNDSNNNNNNIIMAIMCVYIYIYICSNGL